MASNYNHVPRPPVVAVRDGRARVIVRRETEEDLLAPRRRLSGADRWRGAGRAERRPDGGTTGVQHVDTGRMTAVRRPGRSGGAERESTSDDRAPLRVALLGCGVVGSAVARLLTEHADDLAARVGAPLELVGIAVRRAGRDRSATGVDPALFTTDAEALVTRRRRRRRGHRRHRAGPLA